MDELKRLYQEVILDHNKNPRNFGQMENPTHHAEGYNPLCGDRYSVYLNVQDGKIENARFDGAGCAISKSSASLMTSLLKGVSVEDAKEFFSKFQQMLMDKIVPEDLPDKLQRVAALQGVKEFPIRIKCATLVWHTMKSALEGKDKVSTE